MLAILATHPIQYQVPLWQALANDGSVPFEVWYLTDHGVRPSYDQQFGTTFAWDLDTLSGYPHRFLSVNADADVTRFNKVRLKQPLTKLLREKNVKALWVQGWQVRAYWQAVWQSHKLGIPVWLRAESNDLARVPFWKKVPKRLLLGEFFRRVDRFLYIGQANRRLYESYGVRSEQLCAAPYCVDNERFERQANDLRPQRAAIRQAWAIPDDAFCVLFAGKFITKKRPIDLMEAAKLMMRSGSKLKTENSKLSRIHLLFVGSGELGGTLRHGCHVVFDADGPSTNGKFSATNGHRPNASFTGFLNQADISKAYVAADCLALPSNPEETWGLVINEAMVSGLPCVVSDACGCAEDLIAPLSPGSVFPVGDVNALSRALGAAEKNPVSITQLKPQVAQFGIRQSINTIRWLNSLLIADRGIRFERGA